MKRKKSGEIRRGGDEKNTNNLESTRKIMKRFEFIFNF